MLKIMFSTWKITRLNEAQLATRRRRKSPDLLIQRSSASYTKENTMDNPQKMDDLEHMEQELEEVKKDYRDGKDWIQS